MGVRDVAAGLDIRSFDFLCGRIDDDAVALGLLDDIGEIDDRGVLLFDLEF